MSRLFTACAAQEEAEQLAAAIQNFARRPILLPEKLAVLSERDKDLKAWTYDREFRTTWRRPNGTAIPLAVKSA